MRILIPATLLALFVIPRQANHSPIVKIEAPANNATLTISSGLSYQIQVTDQEDGDTRYDEINTKEVILEQAYLAAEPGNPTKPASPARAPALDIMAANSCFNCHQFNAQS